MGPASRPESEDSPSRVTVTVTVCERIDNVCAFKLYRRVRLFEGGKPRPTAESSGPTRDIDINLRAQRRQRDLIDPAAALLGRTCSDFMPETACREAGDVLPDQRVFTLDADRFMKFQAMLDASPSETPMLRKLMATKAPWKP